MANIWPHCYAGLLMTHEFYRKCCFSSRFGFEKKKNLNFIHFVVEEKEKNDENDGNDDEEKNRNDIDICVVAVATKVMCVFYTNKYMYACWFFIETCYTHIHFNELTHLLTLSFGFVCDTRFDNSISFSSSLNGGLKSLMVGWLVRSFGWLPAGWVFFPFIVKFNKYLTKQN